MSICDRVGVYEKWATDQDAVVLSSSYLPKILGLHRATPREKEFLVKKLTTPSGKKDYRKKWGLKGQDEAQRQLTTCGYPIQPPLHPSGKYAGCADGLIMDVHGLKRCHWENKSVTKLARVWTLDPKDLVQMHANMEYDEGTQHTLYSRYHPSGTAVFLVEFNSSFWAEIVRLLDDAIQCLRNGAVDMEEIPGYSGLASQVRYKRVMTIRTGCRYINYSITETIDLDPSIPDPEPRIEDLTRSKHFLAVYARGQGVDLSKYRYKSEQMQVRECGYRMCVQTMSVFMSK